MSHGLNAQEMDDLPHRHIFFGDLTDSRNVTLTWKHNTDRYRLLVYNKQHQKLVRKSTACTKDDNKQVKHLLCQTVPLHQLILKMVSDFTVRMLEEQKSLFLNNQPGFTCLVFA